MCACVIWLQTEVEQVHMSLTREGLYLCQFSCCNDKSNCNALRKLKMEIKRKVVYVLRSVCLELQAVWSRSEQVSAA